ncbi:MAG TPA: prepilin peptidase [Mycobacteriales bacterium]|nr:prepilin peptidase [Mycobacteriales bacterium]
MDTLLAVACGVWGLVIGSFLNVVIWRVPRDESVVRPPSHCPSCDKPISPRDNVPVVSWLLLRGRCRHCQARISIRYPLVELATAGLLTAFAVRFGPHAALPAFLYLGCVGIALAMIDLDVQRLPDKLTLPSYPVALVLLGIAAMAQGAGWPYARALIGMAAMFSFYAALWFVYPAGMGLGDVKLSGVLGLYLGWLSWRALVVGAASAFLVGAVVSVVILLVVQGSGRKTKVPFGPFMLLGVLIAIFAADPIAHGYLHTFNR